jgi:hypothetical protein
MYGDDSIRRPMGVLMRSAARLAAVVALTLTFYSASASAQCPGDCDGNDQVNIGELITAVNVALGDLDLSSCEAADTSGDGEVSIGELIQAVNAALDGCPATPTPTDTVEVDTPTPTETPMPTDTPAPDSCGDEVVDPGEECDDGMQCTAGMLGDACMQDSDCDDERVGIGVCETRDGDGCQANCLLPVCGDGVVDNTTEGETCDDGDASDECQPTSIQCCPADCTVADCRPGDQTFSVNVDFQTDLTLLGLTLFVQYPDSVVQIPSSGNDAPVIARVSSDTFPGPALNDRDYGLTFVGTNIFGTGQGTAMTIEFDVCSGAKLPAAGSFSCLVQEATDELVTTVTEQVSCSVVIP